MTRVMLELLLAVSIVIAGAVANRPSGTTPATAATPDTHVAQWDATAMAAMLANPGITPTEQIPLFAYIGIAVYDSVVAINGGYEPFLVEVIAPQGALAEAAVAAAARTILLHHLTAAGAVAIVNNAYTDALAGLPDGQPKVDGISVGEAVAQAVIAARDGDGFRAAMPPYVDPDPPTAGVFLSDAFNMAPPPPVGPIGMHLARMTPFVLNFADELRPAGPPKLHTGRWARDYNEVKETGSATSSTRTAEQTTAAVFWGENPVAQAHGGLRYFLHERQLEVVDAARLMAMVTVTQADAMIACFDAKYHYAFWRPITAIRAGDTDGNRATIADPDWMSLLATTPNHPEYPSAHSCVTPAAARVIARFLGTGNIEYTIPSLAGNGDRYYRHFNELVREVGEARIWGGIHYRFAVDDGATIGIRTANRVLSEHFQQARK